MKRFKLLIIILALLVVSPTTCYASSESSGEEGSGAGIINPCSPNCSGIVRSSSLGGVRITFVDASGHVVPASGNQSFDFVTYVRPGKEGINFFYNSFSGDRNKIAMSGGANYSEGTSPQSSFKRFSAVASAYNNNEPGHKASLPTSGNTGGSLNKGYGAELNFFLGLTRTGNPTYAQDVNAFIKAIAEVSGGFNAEDLIYKVAEGCNTGEEIFIVMEPLFFWSGKTGGGYTNYFGTLADSYHFFGGSIPGSVGLYNTNRLAYVIYYEREIAAYKGATGVSKDGFKIQSAADLLSTAGFGLAVDWANDPGQYCNSCSYENGKFSYDNKIYPGDLVIPSGFKSIEDYAFTGRDSGGAGCCDILEPQIGSMPKEWQEAYDKLCREDEPDCCTPSVPKEPPVIDVHNCCEDSPLSKVIDSELDDIFCYDSELQVEYFKNRCENDRYKEKLNDYCDIYCTERVTMEVPQAITATSGRYFTLSKTSKGTTSPYIEGFRRCRVKVYYNEWRKKYAETVKRQVDQYNEFQRQASMEKNYEEALPTKETIHETGTITTSCSETDNSTTPPTKKSSTGSATFDYVYYKWTFKNNYNYHTVDLKDDHYTRVEIVRGQTLKEPHEPYSLYKYDEAKAAYDAAKSQAASNCGLGNVSYGGTQFKEFTASYRNENPEEVINTIKQAKESAKAAYEIATKEADTLEHNIDECDYYFDDSKSRLEEKATYDGKDAEKHYSFTPDLLFRYSQVYLGEDGKAVLDTLAVEFDRSCEYKTLYDKDETDVDEIKPDRYSGIYSNGSERMHDFDKDVELVYEPNGVPLSKYYDYEYKAEKLFTTDAKYHATCKWTEKDKDIYTLVPSGISSETSVFNHTIHNREYKIYLSTFDGTYQTYWDINNVGHKGGFTSYFQRGTKTCAGENPEDIGTTITCKIHVEHELVQTGKCNGSNGTDTTISEDDCDINKEGYDLFAFKVADPQDLFPTGTETASGTIAYNWTQTERGKQVMNEIQEKGATVSNYAPENVSYQVTLGRNDMNHIKNYNRSLEDENGYQDFNLHCECPTNKQTNTLLGGGVGCTQCKSYFLENLEKGIVKYDNVEHKVKVWSSPKSLQSIRETAASKNRW